MSAVTLHDGDSRDVLKGMIERGKFVDSVCCDPPYGLKSVVKRFGKQGAKPAKPGRDGSFSRVGKGFMGKQWDGTEIECDPEFWRLVWQVLKPGGYIVAFSSSRTYHRMACAIEDAGFVTHPMIGWCFGSGFPKAHNAAMAIDKALGRKGEVVPAGEPVRRIRPGANQNKDGSWEKLEDREYQPGSYVPATEEAMQWDGWHYGGQVRKPALEPIYVGQKPFSEKNGALNILKYGVGAVNIDGCRVLGENTRRENKADMGYHGGLSAADEGYSTGSELGRWPANLIHDGSPDVVELFPESAGAQAPVKGTEPSHTGDENTVCYGKYGRVPGTFYGDQSGSAARFFECYPFEGTPVFYHTKASTKDRINKCTACSRRFVGKLACTCVDENGKKARSEAHPTVKPTNLMRSLVRHITPPGGTVLDPFAGTGTTGKAAVEEGMRAVLIEMEPEYAADIRCRLNLPEPIDDPLDGLISSNECRYCGNTGWSYGDKELGPCGCKEAVDFEDLLGGEAVPINSTDCGFKELLG